MAAYLYGVASWVYHTAVSAFGSTSRLEQESLFEESILSGQERQVNSRVERHNVRMRQYFANAMEFEGRRGILRVMQRKALSDRETVMTLPTISEDEEYGASDYYDESETDYYSSGAEEFIL